MTSYLSSSDHFFGSKGKMSFTDQSGNEVYRAEAESFSALPVWRVMWEGRDVASVRRVLASPPSWEVDYGYAAYRIKSNYSGAGGSYDVIGGPYHGAYVQGRRFKRDLNIYYRGRIVAYARSPRFIFRDRSNIEVVDKAKDAELFTICTMVAHHMSGYPGILLGLFFNK